MNKLMRLKWVLGLLFFLSLQTASAFYDPAPQRWINRDPISEMGGKNLYRFINNNAPNKFDSFGLHCGSGITDILVPDSPGGFDFTDCCVAHDACYRTFEANRLDCDNEFLNCMMHVCNDAGGSSCCEAYAQTYYAVVRLLGWMFFNPTPFDPDVPLPPPGGIPGYEFPDWVFDPSSPITHEETPPTR